MMNRYEIKKYLTFEEVLAIIANSFDSLRNSSKDLNPYNFNYNENFGQWNFINESNQIKLNSIYHNGDAFIELLSYIETPSQFAWMYQDEVTRQYFPTENVKKLFDTLFNKYSDSYMTSYVDTDLEINVHGVNKFSQNIWKIIIRLINKINTTYSKYSKLLDLYKAQEDNLLKGVGSSYTDETSGDTSGSSRFNDTPQDSGDFSDDSHTSSLTQNSSEASSTIEHEAEDDRYTLMERLEKVQNAYLNVIEAWAREFKGFFYLKVNLEVL